MSRQPSLFPLLIATGIVVVLLLAPLPSSRITPWPALFEAAENLCHPLIFGVLAVLLLRYLLSRRTLLPRNAALLTLLACVMLGGTAEWLQSLCGRDGSWSDLQNDALGAAAAICGATCMLRLRAAARRDRALWPAVAAFIFALLAVAPFLFVVAGYAQRAMAAPVFWRADSRLLQQFAAFTAGNYQALVVREPPSDWRDYRYLVVDVTNEGAAPRMLQLRVHDALHDGRYADRFHGMLFLPPGRSQQRIDLNAVRTAPRGRLMQMQSIRGLALFVRRPETLSALRIEQLALER